VNGHVTSDSQTTVQAWRDGKWHEVGQAAYRVDGNGLELALPRRLIRQTGRPAFDFHWADNVQNLDSASPFGVNGDSAPNRRWNYRYEKR
jgi:hypothetical protein